MVDHCLFKCGRGTGAAAQEAYDFAMAEADKVYARDSDNQRALRHCIATAYLAKKVGYHCAICVANKREDYQRDCLGHGAKDYNIGTKYNSMGAAIYLFATDINDIIEKCKQRVADRPPDPDTGIPTHQAVGRS